MMLDVHQIAAALGGQVTGTDTVNVPGPGHSPADRSLSIKVAPDAPEGFVVHSHANDDPMLCRDYVRQRLGLPDWRSASARNWQQAAKSQVPDQAKLKSLALKIWDESTNPIGTAVEHYLSDHRGLALPPELAGNSIRFHPKLYFDHHTHLPAMVCLWRSIDTAEPCGILRTWLDPKDNKKVSRKNLGRASGAAIQFDKATSCLTIGEGVESVLSARAAGYSPAWALGSSGSVKSFPVLKSLSELVILEENDQTSPPDVAICSNRFLEAGLAVTIIASKVGKDFNDAWRAAQ
ncbi:toprim domain-containing protein [Bradyrhizobium sp. MOS001]|uniref:DUF7146 domain-containing protein n=1 Tax=Bradyrhizobium sp. MOS001 TaxID=2133948 RepID=UPI001FCEE18B|nr:toprim domain-containing protein [Bradyrhizobium sp. MOS001]